MSALDCCLTACAPRSQTGAPLCELLHDRWNLLPNVQLMVLLQVHCLQHALLLAQWEEILHRSATVATSAASAYATGPGRTCSWGHAQGLLTVPAPALVPQQAAPWVWPWQQQPGLDLRRCCLVALLHPLRLLLLVQGLT